MSFHSKRLEALEEEHKTRICIVCKLPKGYPPKHKRILVKIKKLFGISSYCYRAYCTQVSIYCKIGDHFTHHGCSCKTKETN